MARLLPTWMGQVVLYAGFSLAVTILVLLLTHDILFEFPPITRAELSLIDLRFQERGNKPHTGESADVIIVEISQESHKSLPEKWPWPRSYYTRLVRNLKLAGAKAVGLDILFTSPDTRGSENDTEFRKALIEAGNVVLAAEVEPERELYTKYEAGENYGNIFIEPAMNFGFVNVRPDVDGVVRRYLPLTRTGERRIPAFGFALLNLYAGQPSQLTPDAEESGFHFLGRTIPPYDEASFLINFYGPSGTFKRINIRDVLDDSEFQTVEELENPGLEINTFDDTTALPSFDGSTMVPNGYLHNRTFEGKIVLVGSTRPEDKDLFPVAIAEGRQAGDNQMYGVEIHANVIQSILDGNFVARTPFWMTALIAFGLCVLTLVLTLGLRNIKTSYGVAIQGLSIAIVLSELYLIYWISVKLFVDHSILLDTMTPLLAVAFSFVASTVHNYLGERKQKVLIKNMFSHYVNPTVVDEIVAHPEKLRLGGERRTLTVFFSDIEGFTRISEKVPPEDLVAILNEYLSRMTEILLANDGTLDKYEGDAIVAFWGAPIPFPDHPLRACRTAMQMQAALANLRGDWESRGKPRLNVRIGINTGDVIVGNMGGTTRFDYTVIGDTVNLGARLEGVNKQYGTNVIISENTYALVASEVLARELDYLVVAGKTEPIRVYELLGMADGKIESLHRRLIELYEKGLHLFRQRQWQSAINTFEQALAIKPDDQPSKLLIQRSREFLISPPADDWSGISILTTK